ncbi:MAG: tetratricopeptide repeat protein [Sterolibacteriaceae bacterium]|uniref:Tetratricopeptide repeat protein n=1 Tax=Candidatus Methylophosphatis roskildensis TaxID=2899263 RepID=A0A9D7E6C2_9PROT|nr:tetratricopeptide repeat protein [Candidatus Methylophosphatis roskildensis]MBK7236168.1 tetratricopeptide repeat protein [Sterolibacteriaceae bacterium]
MSSHRLDLREIIVEALVDHFPQCAHDVVAVATETTEHLSRLAETAFLRLESAVKGQVAGLLRSQLQEESVRLAELHVLVTGFLVEKWRQRKEKKPLNSSDLAEYAKVLGNHAVALGRSGRTDQALVCEREVRNSFEGLVRKDRRRHEPDYATSLSNYAAYLSEVGQSDEALEHAKQALEIRRRLAQTRPDRYEPDYAGSLSNYANGLSAVGQSDEALEHAKQALEHAKQALEIYRRLAQARPDRYEPDYATSLNNYAACLSAVGQSDEALEHAKQALEIYRRLAQARPDRYEPDYATSLNNYANRLSEVGQSDEALEHAKQALEIYRRLAQARPDRYEPDYATSLSNYAAYLSAVGQSDEALEHAKQALEIRRRLAQARPDRYEPDYAGSLSNYANGLSAVGQSDEALEHAKQALEIRRRLAQARPDRFEDTRLSASCLMHFLSWLCDRHATDSPLPDPNAIPETIRPRRRPVLVLYTAFVQGCLAADEASRAKAFEQVHLAWDILPLADRSAVRDCWLCAAAWCETLVPEMLAQVDWQAEWRSFKTQRHGRVPHWMVEVARRLSFRWPS